MQQHHCHLLIIGDNKDIKDESYLCDRACMCVCVYFWSVVLKIQSIITGCRTGRWLDCYCSEAAWSLWSPELSWRPLYFASPVIGAAELSKYMLFLSFSTPSACCLSLPPHSHTSVLVSLLLLSFPIPLILSMTVSPPSVFPCVSLMIYWFIDVAIPCKLLFWLSANKGRKTHASELRTRSSHASPGSLSIADPDQPTTSPCPCGCVFSWAKSPKSQMRGVSCVWMRCLASLQSLRAGLPMLCLHRHKTAVELNQFIL